jgi:hypothetical protein
MLTCFLSHTRRGHEVPGMILSNDLKKREPHDLIVVKPCLRVSASSIYGFSILTSIVWKLH